VQCLDVQGVAAQQAPGEHVVQVRLDGAGAVERFAQAGHAGIGLDADPQDVGELGRAQRLDAGDLHPFPTCRIVGGAGAPVPAAPALTCRR